MTTTATTHQTCDGEVRPRTSTDDIAETVAHGRIGRVVAGSLIGGLVAAILAVIGPFAGAQEHVITGAVLLTFAASWFALAFLSQRRTDQPQRWAYVPAAFMATAGITVLITAATGNELGWVWPPITFALAVWMAMRARRELHSHTRFWIVYPICITLAAACLGGAYETYRESTDSFPMPGRLVDVGEHRLHINCAGTGSPTVVLEPGLGEPSTAMAWIARGVAPTTRVCVYDRAGRGWSEAADGPQDGVEVATDLHTLLARAGEHGPFVLAGHSVGGLYVLNYAHLYPTDVAGVVLLDSMHPDQYTKIDGWSAFYEMNRRGSALLTPLSRFGIGQLMYGTAYQGLPADARDAERSFMASNRGNRSARDEFSTIRTSMAEAKALTTFDDRPLYVLSAKKEAQGGWAAAQNDLARLSTNSVHSTLANAEHSMLTEDEHTAAQSSKAIEGVVRAVRNGRPLAPTRVNAAPSLLPEPTGRNAIGVRTVAGVAPDAVTRVWYPAQSGTGTALAVYGPPELASANGLPAEQLNHAVLRARIDAKSAPARSPRPAVVLMPGWGLPMALSSSLAQELASNGYVVVAVDPTPGSEDRMTLPADTANPGRRLQQVTAAINYTTGSRIRSIAGPIDPDKIAIGGHSIAGAVAFQTALTDGRVRAVFDLDGWLHGSALRTPVGVSALMINASGLEPATRAIVARTPSAVTVRLAGATHIDVIDAPCLVQNLAPAAKAAFGLGTIGCAGTTTTNTVVRRFLDAVLKRAGSTPSAARLTANLDAAN